MILLDFYRRFGFGSWAAVHAWEMADNEAINDLRLDGKAYWHCSLGIHGEHTRWASMGWLDSRAVGRTSAAILELAGIHVFL